MRLLPRSAALSASLVGLFAASVVASNLHMANRLRHQHALAHLEELRESGALEACAQAPITWSHPSVAGGTILTLRAWERSSPAGEPTPEPPLGELLRLSPLGRSPWIGVWDSGGEGDCRLLVVVLESWHGLARSEIFALLGLRTGLGTLVLLGLLRLGVWPIIQRVRALEEGMRRVVAADFEGEVAERGRDELDQLAAAFNQAAAAARERMEKMRRQEEALREVATDVTHDVRTPLAALKLALSTLRRSPGDLEAVQAASRELDYLDGLIGNLSAAIQLESRLAPPTRAPVDAGELLERVAARCQLLSEAKIVTSTPDQPLILQADPLALEQALVNLLRNASDFARGHVAALAFAQEGWAVLEVRDDGPGPQPSEIPKLSQRYFRGEGGGIRAGYGLGLAIASAVAERHGGALELERGQPAGMIARLRLPLVEAKP